MLEKMKLEELLTYERALSLIVDRYRSNIIPNTGLQQAPNEEQLRYNEFYTKAKGYHDMVLTAIEDKVYAVFDK